MTRDEVMKMLKAYKHELGRSRHLQVQLAELEREMKREEDGLADELVSIGGQDLSGMPRGTAIGKPTENAGIKLADGWKTERLIALEEKWLALRAEFEASDTVVAYVKAWLSGLNDRECWIVEKQIIEAEFWKDILNKYREEYKEQPSKDALRRLRDRALSKIFAMAE